MPPTQSRWIVLAACVGLFLGAGAPAPKRRKERPARPPQYKRLNRDQISRIIDGKAEAVIEQIEERLAQQPRDLESLFVLTVAHCQTGDVAKAVESMHRALAAGLPLERFIAGPRTLLEPLTESDEFRQLARERNPQLIHGPLLGCVTDSSAKLWGRFSGTTRSARSGC